MLHLWSAPKAAELHDHWGSLNWNILFYRPLVSPGPTYPCPRCLGEWSGRPFSGAAQELFYKDKTLLWDSFSWSVLVAEEQRGHEQVFMTCPAFPWKPDMWNISHLTARKWKVLHEMLQLLDYCAKPQQQLLVNNTSTLRSCWRTPNIYGGIHLPIVLSFMESGGVQPVWKGQIFHS